ncbi:acylglycerol kinase-like protein Mulk [Cochliomyia hominivorax]
MEKVAGFVKGHWKKLTFASIPVIYGSNYIKNEYQTFWQMRYVCNEASQYTIPKNSKVLVILNPVANKKRCEKNFKKYCEPIFHTAGYSVDIVKTNHVGHAKSIMESLHELPDVVVVAGGDGTSSEVVTGLLRRKEESCPVLFLPLGENSRTAWNLIRNETKDDTNLVNYLPQRALDIVKNRTQYYPVFKYELIENNDNETRKPIYGLHDFSWGILKEMEVNKDKYWYFGALRHYASILFASLSDKVNEYINVNVVSTPPCPGCSNCVVPKKTKSWFNISKMLNSKLPNETTKEVENSNLCSTEENFKIDAKQIDIRCIKNAGSFFELKTDVIEDISSRSKFIMDMLKQMKLQSSMSIESRTVELVPVEFQHQSYYIDGESYDVRPIKITCIPNTLKCIY